MAEYQYQLLLVPQPNQRTSFNCNNCPPPPPPPPQQQQQQQQKLVLSGL
jgi:hypothetical protein